MSKVNPPKNFREYRPRVCAFCEWYVAGDERWNCERFPNIDDSSPYGDYLDYGHQYETTCDYFLAVKVVLQHPEHPAVHVREWLRSQGETGQK